MKAMAPFVSKKKRDPDYEYYKWEKSHNSKFYKKTRGVLTTTKEELQSILRTTPDTSKPSLLPEVQSGRGDCQPEHEGHMEYSNNNVIEDGDQMINVLTSVEAPEENPPMGKVKKKKRKKRFSSKKKESYLDKYSSREIEREIARNTKRFNEKIQVELLKSALGNPWDEVSLNEKKRFALHFYYSKLQEVGCQPGGKFCARKHAANLVDVCARTVGIWVREFEALTHLKESQRGKHSKTASPMNSPEFREEFKAYVKDNSRKSGEANLTASALRVWVNDRLGLSSGAEYSERTILNWLHVLGFRVTETKKGIYFDGHERPDVKLDRKRFMEEFEMYYKDAVKIDTETLELQDLNKPYIIISQDEKIHHSNDVQSRYWDNGELNFPPSKSQGRTVMTADFLEPISGFLEYKDDVWSELKNTEKVQQEIRELGGGEKGECRARRAGSILDVSSDGYYNTNRCKEDFLKAVQIVKANYPDKIPVITTDWSPIHGSYGDDALNVNKMNVGIGGKQPLMKDGYYTNPAGEVVAQPMVFRGGPNQGVAKGLKQVCLERFGPEAIKGKKQDGLVEMLGKEPDFKQQKPQLVEVVEAAGGKVMFGTKFHPELMPIENSYRDISAFMKRRNIIGSSAGYVERVCESYSHVDIYQIRKYFLSVLKFMEIYKTGETGNRVFELMKKQRKKHRGGAEFDPDIHRNVYNRQRLFTV